MGCKRDEADEKQIVEIEEDGELADSIQLTTLSPPAFQSVLPTG